MNRIRTFLETLAAVTPEQLATVVGRYQTESGAPVVDVSAPGDSQPPADWWYFFRTGQLKKRGADSYLYHAARFQSEMAETIGALASHSEVISIWNGHVRKLVEGAALHLLAAADYEVRLFGRDAAPWLMGVGRSRAVPGPSGVLSFNLHPDEAEEIRRAQAGSGDTRATLYQFISVRLYERGIRFDYPSAIQLGDSLWMPHALRASFKAGSEASRIEQQMRDFQSFEGAKGRRQYTRAIEFWRQDHAAVLGALKTGTPEQYSPDYTKYLEATDLDGFPLAVIELYLGQVATSDLVPRLLKERLEALLSPGGWRRSEERDLMQALCSAPSALSLESLAESLGMTTDQMRCRLDEMNQSTQAQWSQRLARIDGHHVVFQGLELLPCTIARNPTARTGARTDGNATSNASS